jgi:hypothetical protein
MYARPENDYRDIQWVFRVFLRILGKIQYPVPDLWIIVVDLQHQPLPFCGTGVTRER